MADYISKTIDIVKDKSVETVRSVMKSPLVRQLWSAAEDFKQKWSTEDDFVDASANPFGDSTAAATASIFNIMGDSDSSGNKDISQRAKQAQATITERVFSDENLDICMKVLLLIFILTLASFTANSMIFYPSILRLFTFIVVLVGCWFFNSAFTIMVGYYLFYMISALYMNSNLGPGEPRHKVIPHLYSFLPLRTAKGQWYDWMLYPITYFQTGIEGMGHKYYKYQEEEYIDSIKEQIPSWTKIKDTLGVPALLSEFIEHLEAMNVTYKIDASGAAVSAATLPANMSAVDLLTKYKEAVTNKNAIMRKQIMKRLLNKFITDTETNENTALITQIEAFDDSLVKDRYFEEAEEVARLLLSIYQSVSANGSFASEEKGTSNYDRGTGTKKADEAQARLFKVLQKRETAIQSKLDALDKEIAYGKANRLDMKTKEAEKAALTHTLAALKTETGKLERKIRFSSTFPTYDTEGKELDKEINVLMDSVHTLLTKQTGGATTAATTVPSKDPDVNQLQTLFHQINTVFDANEALDWEQLINAKAHILHLNPFTEILKSRRSLREYVGVSNELVQGISDEVTTVTNLRAAQLASAQEETSHAIATISYYAEGLHKKGGLYTKFSQALDADGAKADPKFKSAIAPQKTNLTTRLKKIEDLYAAIHMNKLTTEDVLKLIPDKKPGVGDTTFNTKSSINVGYKPAAAAAAGSAARSATAATGSSATSSATATAIRKPLQTAIASALSAALTGTVASSE